MMQRMPDLGVFSHCLLKRSYVLLERHQCCQETHGAGMLVCLLGGVGTAGKDTFRGVVTSVAGKMAVGMQAVES